MHCIIALFGNCAIVQLVLLSKKEYCDLTNNILISESVNLISYLIYDGEIGDTECIDVT